MYVPKEFATNKFKQVKLKSMRDLHDELGDRVPQPGQTSGTVIHVTSAIDQIRLGEALSNSQFMDQFKAPQPTATPAVEPELTAE